MVKGCTRARRRIAMCMLDDGCTYEEIGRVLRMNPMTCSREDLNWLAMMLMDDGYAWVFVEKMTGICESMLIKMYNNKKGFTPEAPR